MTERDYFCYEMNKDEMDRWQELISDVKRSLYLIADISEIPHQVFIDILGRTTMAKEPWNGAKGYISNSGFYCVEEGDRGKYVTRDMKGFREKHKNQWHYCSLDKLHTTELGIVRIKRICHWIQRMLLDGVEIKSIQITLLLQEMGRIGIST